MPNYEWQQPLTLEKLHKVLSEHPAFSNPLVSLSAATITLNAEKHANRTLLFDRAAGVTATLPAAIGSGDRYEFIIKTIATSNSHIVKVANASDIMQGIALLAQDGGDTSVLFETAADSDTITLNRSTTGSVQKGERIVCRDIEKNTWAVEVFAVATGTEATPFSAGVS